MARARFVNPANGDEYVWHMGPESEEPTGKPRQIVTVPSTRGGKTYRQTAGTEPFTIAWAGKFEHRAQHVAMWQWYQLCENQTIHLYDFDGQGYEVQITDFKPVRRRKLSYTGKDSSVPHHYWEYTITFVVYDFIGGDMEAAGVTP